jgi:hypothetical protein
MVGAPKNNVEEIVASSVAVCRSLGFGHWTIAELKPGERLVLRSSSNYEAPFYMSRYDRSDKPRCYFLRNAARAIMQLAHRVDWESKPVLTEDLYQNLFKSGLSWNVEESLCRCKGDEICEVVVSKA